MQVIELRCPHCAAKLRLRDHSFVGRTIHCPDCTQPVLFSRNSAGVVEAAPGSAVKVPKGAAPSAPSAVDSTLTTTGDPTPATVVNPVKRPPRAPVWIAWGVAALLTLAVLALALLPRPATDPPGSLTKAAHQPGIAPEPAGPPAEAAPPPSPPGHPPPLDLQPLLDLLAADRDRRGRFPAENVQARALPAAERLGWQAAVIAAGDPSGPQPQWDRPVLDPLNSRFVRRRMPLLLNPLLAETAVDGLPPTHFVGAAGVGPDAVQLPATHLRAGIFGAGRDTAFDDVRDGLSNTLLILGAAGRPAPWAAGGEYTMRPLTREPYVNGPDGFGTAQADGMLVVMADGSVRVISQDVDPVVLRRMAAMADGLPLDPAIRGEPGDPAPATIPPSPAPAVDIPAVAPAEPTPAEEPILPQLAADRVLPPPPSYDVERALSQPIVKFSQVRPAPFGELLVQMQDLAGVPIQLAPADEATLSQTVALELSNTTVGAILQGLAQRVGLQVETGTDFGIRLVPSSPP